MQCSLLGLLEGSVCIGGADNMDGRTEGKGCDLRALWVRVRVACVHVACVRARRVRARAREHVHA